MKNLKKVLALVVALTMVFTTVAFASYPDVDVEADYAGAVELLSALDILKGDDNGNFNPDNTITRAEFAAVVCRALGLENSAASAKGATMFKDVAADHWASGYINLASQQGIINGKGNGMFDPEGNVTYAEAVKMLVVAIGYEPMAATKGGWPTGYLSVANSTKMTAGVGGAADVAALRSTVAMLTANAIEIPVMDQTAFGSETKYEPMDDYDNYTSLLTQQDVYKATGIVGEIDLVEGTFVLSLTEESEDYAFGWINSYTVDPKIAVGTADYTFDIGKSNVVEFATESVDVYVKKSGRKDYVALIAVPSGIGETLTINASDLEKTKATISSSARTTLEYYETPDADKTSDIYVEKDPKVIINGVTLDTEYDNANLYTKLGTKDAEIKFVENTDDKYFDIINITVYEHAIVDEVVVDRNRIQFLDGVNKVSFDPDDENQVVNIFNAEGKEITIADIQVGDVLAMVVGDKHTGTPKSARTFKEKITIYDLGASSVTGTLNQANESEGYVYIDGVQYEYNTEFVSEDKYADLFDTKGTSTVYTDDEAELGTEGIFYLSMTGKIIGFAAEETAAGNYAFVLQAEDNKAASWDKCWQMKVLKADGSIVTLNIADDAEIDGVETDYDTTQAAALASVKGAYDNSKDAANAYKRVIEYKTNSKDEVVEIEFAMNDKNADVETVNGEFSARTLKADSSKLASDVVIFNVEVSDVDDATVIDVTSLVDEATYAGQALIKKDSKYDVLVMTKGGVVFDAEAPVYIVDSVVKSTYGEDKESAIEVNYYADGSSDLYTAIFTSDSEAYASSSLKPSTLAKGSIFVANMAEDGLVDKYMVLANIVNKTIDTTGLEARLKATYGSDVETTVGDGVEFIYGTIQKIDGNVLYIGKGTDEKKWEDISIESGAAQYYYNSEGSKAKLESGTWYGDNVDLYEDGKGNTVFAMMYDGDVIFAVAYSDKVAEVSTVKIVK